MDNNKMPDTYGPSTLAQNATVYHRFDSNTSYEVTLGDIIIRQNETPGTGPSCIITMNVTVRNSGTDPIGIIFQTEDIQDYAGDLCQSRALSWCGTLFLGTIHPETSKTGTEDIPIFSTKGCDYLSAEKFLLKAVMVADSDKVGGIQQKGWLIDLKKSPDPAPYANSVPTSPVPESGTLFPILPQVML